MKDERYLTLAKAFNFGKDGNVTVPLTAQSQGTIKAIASDYTVMMTRFLEDDKKDKAKEDAKEEVAYYSEKLLSIQKASDFYNDERLTNIVLTAYGIDPATVKKDFLKQVFTSDLGDPNSFVNKQTNSVWAEILAPSISTRAETSPTTSTPAPSRAARSSRRRTSIRARRSNRSRGKRTTAFAWRSISSAWPAR